MKALVSGKGTPEKRVRRLLALCAKALVSLGDADQCTRPLPRVPMAPSPAPILGQRLDQ